MWEKVAIVRDEKGLNEALKQLLEMQKENREDYIESLNNYLHYHRTKLTILNSKNHNQ